jgi:hypothetical protein
VNRLDTRLISTMSLCPPRRAPQWGSHGFLVRPGLIFGNDRGCGWSRERFRLPSRGQDQETPERSVSFPISHMHPPLLIR